MPGHLQAITLVQNNGVEGAEYRQSERGCLQLIGLRRRGLSASAQKDRLQIFDWKITKDYLEVVCLTESEEPKPSIETHAFTEIMFKSSHACTLGFREQGSSRTICGCSRSRRVLLRILIPRNWFKLEETEQLCEEMRQGQKRSEMTTRTRTAYCYSALWKHTCALKSPACKPSARRAGTGKMGDSPIGRARELDSETGGASGTFSIWG